MTTFKEIEAARDRIKGAVFYSPCLPSIPLSEITGHGNFLQADNLQRTGSFKERGARNALAQLSADQKKRGVIAASAGNHAQALAYQGKLLRIPATVVMPKFATRFPMPAPSSCRWAAPVSRRRFARHKNFAAENKNHRGWKRKMWPAFPLRSKLANRPRSRCIRRWPTVWPLRRSAQTDSKSRNRASTRPSS